MNPQPIANILSELISRRGYASEQASAAYDNAWRQAAGEFIAKQTRVGRVQRGKLEIHVANSTLVQELNFRKADLIQQLARLLPAETITDLKLRVGAIK